MGSRLDDGTQQRILESVYACVAQWGVAKTTMEDVAHKAKISRATLYRYFPGGREEIVQSVIAWQAAKFLAGLYEVLHGSQSLQDIIERLMLFSSGYLRNHTVLNRIIAAEPNVVLPELTTEVNLVTSTVSGFLVPYLKEFGVGSRVRVHEAADYLARMLFSYISSPGQWDLEDPIQVAELVRVELLGGIAG
ncbi:MAG: TetR/AcrR family transcriptional regulator [Acidimicrobiales bacterium]